MAQMRRKAIRPTMKRQQKGKITYKHIYGIISLVALLISIGWLFLPGKETPRNEARTNSDFKSSSLGRFHEFNEQIKKNKITGDELDRLEIYKRNVMIVSGYEGYTPFSNLYHKIQEGLHKSPEGEQLYTELRKFGSEVRERLSVFLDEPTDDRLHDFEQYLITLKPEIQRLIDMTNKTSNVEPRTLDKITDNLVKFRAAIDHRQRRQR